MEICEEILLVREISLTPTPLLEERG